MDLITLSLLKRISNLEARIEALEPKNLFNIEAILEENPEARFIMNDGKVAILSGNGVYSESTDVFPDLIEGETYTFSCDVESLDTWWSANPPSVECGGYSSYVEDYRIIFTFTATKPNRINFVAGVGDVWVDDPEYEYGGYYEYCPAPAIFYNIMINEGTEPASWKPYKK